MRIAVVRRDYFAIERDDTAGQQRRATLAGCPLRLVLGTDYPFFVLAALTGQLCFLALSLTRLTHCGLSVHHLIKAIELPI